MALVLDWQKKLGYRKDPFVDEPTQDIVGLHDLREHINLFLLKNHQVGIITAEDGMGKTSFVLWLKKELQGKRRVREVNLKEITSAEKLEAYLERETEAFYKKIPGFDKLYEHMTNVQRTKEVKREELIKKLKKDTILLIIEDASKLVAAHVNLLNELLDQTQLEILLFDTQLKNPLAHKPGLSSEIREYPPEELEELLQRRIEAAGSVGTFPFDESELKKLFKKSGGNPRQLLASCRERAIELSLKELPLPKKVKEIGDAEEVKDKETDEEPKTIKPAAKKGFSLFGNIKFEVVDEPPEAPRKSKDKSTNKLKDKSKAEHSKTVEDELSEETLEDAELLKKMVEEGFK